MDINSLSQETYVNLFEANPQETPEPEKKPLSQFSGFEEETDLLKNQNPSLTEETTLPPEEEKKEGEEETDILDVNTSKSGRKPKYDFSDITGYIKNRVESKKYVSAVEENEKGEIVDFIPKTPEEIDEFFDLQIEHKLKDKEKEVAVNWYNSKSYAWQVVAKYSELVEDPSELLPIIQGVSTITTVADLDESTDAGAESIIRARLTNRGESAEFIEDQINGLKTAGTLIRTAEKWKPQILQEENLKLQQLQAQQQQQNQEYLNTINRVREGAIKAIEAPVFGKQKLKQEEKAMVYNLIGHPSKETNGYGIYDLIDSLFEKGDFNKLLKISLLAAKEDSFNSYFSTTVANETAANLQRKIRTAEDSRNHSKQVMGDPDKNVIVRQKYKTSGITFGG